MCIVEKAGRVVCIRVHVSGSPEVLCVVLNCDGIGLVFAPANPPRIRLELSEFPGLLQMVRAYEPGIRRLEISSES